MGEARTNGGIREASTELRMILFSQGTAQDLPVIRAKTKAPLQCAFFFLSELEATCAQGRRDQYAGCTLFGAYYPLMHTISTKELS